MPQNTKITMKRALPLLALLVWCTSCSRSVQQQTPAFRLEADTLRQGGLELLHNIAIIDAEGTVLFTDSTTDFEPDHFSVFVPDSSHTAKPSAPKASFPPILSQFNKISLYQD